MPGIPLYSARTIGTDLRSHSWFQDATDRWLRRCDGSERALTEDAENHWDFGFHVGRSTCRDLRFNSRHNSHTQGFIYNQPADWVIAYDKRIDLDAIRVRPLPTTDRIKPTGQTPLGCLPVFLRDRGTVLIAYMRTYVL